MVSDLNHRTNIRADRAMYNFARKESKCTTVIKIGSCSNGRASTFQSSDPSSTQHMGTSVAPWLLTMHNLDFFKLFSEEPIYWKVKEADFILSHLSKRDHNYYIQA